MKFILFLVCQFSGFVFQSFRNMVISLVEFNQNPLVKLIFVKTSSSLKKFVVAINVSYQNTTGSLVIYHFSSLMLLNFRGAILKDDLLESHNQGPVKVEQGRNAFWISHKRQRHEMLLNTFTFFQSWAATDHGVGNLLWQNFPACALGLHLRRH